MYEPKELLHILNSVVLNTRDSLLKSLLIKQINESDKLKLLSSEINMRDKLKILLNNNDMSDKYDEITNMVTNNIHEPISEEYIDIVYALVLLYSTNIFLHIRYNEMFKETT